MTASHPFKALQTTLLTRVDCSRSSLITWIFARAKGIARSMDFEAVTAIFVVTTQNNRKQCV